MISMMPSSAKSRMKGELSVGRIPTLTISEPKARKYRTDVSFVFAAITLAT